MDRTAETAGEGAAPRQVTTRQKVGFLAMVVGMFMAILDIQIVSSSLAEIQAGLSASADEISWVQTSYLIAEVVMIPLSGMLARLMSTRILYVASAVGFTCMSVACAFAWSIESMLVFRAAQGFLGGAMIPTVFATSYALFPREKQAGVAVVIGLVATMGPTLGPTVGGFVTQTFSWHLLFLENLPPGIAIAVLVWLFIDVDRPDQSLLKSFDFAGLLFMALFLGSLEYVLEEGPRQDWFEDGTILGLSALCVVSAACFFVRVLSYAHPIVELRTFRNRNFALGCLFSFTIGIGLYGATYLMPLFLASVRGFNSLQIGLVMIVTGCFQFLSAPIAGILAKRLDLRVMLAIGLCLFGAGFYLNSILTADSDFWELFLPQAVRGLSLMMCFVPVNALALGTLPPEMLKNGSGLYNLMRNLGGAIGLAMINTVLTERLALHQSRLSDHLSPTSPQLQSWLEGTTALLAERGIADPEAGAVGLLSSLVQREATILTFSDCLILMSGAFFLALLLMPLVRRPRGIGAAAGH
jgi:MFS transporter, DHA2 family, multidrug resistance protein